MTFRAISAALLVSIAGLWSTGATNDAVIEVLSPATVPNNAANIVDHAFGSISIAFHDWPAYGKISSELRLRKQYLISFIAGNGSGSPNLLSRMLIDVLANKTGAHPIIRVGGTSA